MQGSHQPAKVLLVLAIGCVWFAACAPPPSARDTSTAKVTPTPSVSMSVVPTHTPVARAGTLAPTHTSFPVAGELHLAIRENTKTLNPYLASNASEEFVANLLYDTLLDDDPRHGLQPNLAERWELTPDGMSLTFWLNPQAKWHDGQPVTTQDVVFSFNLVQQWSFPGLVRLVALVDRVEAISAQEVKFTLLTKNGDIVRLLGSMLFIVPAHVWGKVDDPLHAANLDQPIGSGPFLFLEYTEGKQLVLGNTRVHHHTQPRIDRLVLEILRDEDKALRALKEGKLDALGWDVTPQVVNDVQKQASSTSILWVEAPGMRTHTLLLNLRKPPYDNRAFREALARAVDVQAIINTLLLGFGDAATPGLFPSASPWRNASIAPLTFDPQQASKTLDAAGFLDSNGDGVRENPDGSTLQILIACPNSSASLRVAELIVANWQAVGIAAKVTPVAQDALLPQLMQAQFDVALYNLALSEPEMAFFHFHSSRGLLTNGRISGLNYGGYASAEYDELAAAAQEEQDPSRRQELLYRLQAILATDLPQIPLYIPRVLSLYREDHFTGWSAPPGSGLLSRATVAALQAR